MIVMWEGILLPFLGTSVGAACVLLMRWVITEKMQKILTGFAAGVMTAAAVWSLLLPAIEQAQKLGRLAFIPAVTGFWLGIVFLLAVDFLTSYLSVSRETRAQLADCGLSRTAKLVWAVVLHNIPEGMAVGAVCAGWSAQVAGITAMSVLILSFGIAVQNVPEGAIISMPLYADGMSREKACLCGILSGAVEPLAALVTIVLSGILIPAMPYLLGFAAGAMIFVVAGELIPEMTMGEDGVCGTVLFAVGFTVMMVLDVALG